MNKPYVVTEYRKQRVEDESYIETEHRYRTAREAIENADHLADLAEQDLNEGKIVDFMILY